MLHSQFPSMSLRVGLPEVRRCARLDLNPDAHLGPESAPKAQKGGFQSNERDGRPGLLIILSLVRASRLSRIEVVRSTRTMYGEFYEHSLGIDVVVV